MWVVPRLHPDPFAISAAVLSVVMFSWLCTEEQRGPNITTSKQGHPRHTPDLGRYPSQQHKYPTTIHRGKGACKFQYQSPSLPTNCVVLCTHFRSPTHALIALTHVSWAWMKYRLYMDALQSPCSVITLIGRSTLESMVVVTSYQILDISLYLWLLAGVVYVCLHLQ